MKMYVDVLHLHDLRASHGFAGDDGFAGLVADEGVVDTCGMRSSAASIAGDQPLHSSCRADLVDVTG